MNVLVVHEKELLPYIKHKTTFCDHLHNLSSEFLTADAIVTHFPWNEAQYSKYKMVYYAGLYGRSSAVMQRIRQVKDSIPIIAYTGADEDAIHTILGAGVDRVVFRTHNFEQDAKNVVEGLEYLLKHPRQWYEKFQLEETPEGLIAHMQMNTHTGMGPATACGISFILRGLESEAILDTGEYKADNSTDIMGALALELYQGKEFTFTIKSKDEEARQAIADLRAIVSAKYEADIPMGIIKKWKRDSPLRTST